MAKKKLDPKAKAKRQKIIAGVGGVLLLGLLAFQIPKTLKMMNQNQNPPTTTSATSTTPASGAGAPLAPPSLGGSAAPASSVAPSSSGLNEGVAPGPTAGQLVSFSRFSTKDPFAQQVQSSCAVDSTSGSATSASCPAAPSTPASSPAKTTPTPTTPTTGVVTPTPSTPSVTFASRTTATISVNGVAGTVKVGAGFPQTQPIFQLVSLTRTSAKISIAGGTLEGGAPTVTLTKGKQLTLMNTADGSRYVLKLLATAA